MLETVAEFAGQIVGALRATPKQSAPFRHWRLAGILPEAALDALNAREMAPPTWEGADGRRAWNNDRTFVDQQMQEEVPEAAALAEALQTPEVLAAVEEMCGLDLTGPSGSRGPR